MKNKFKHRSQLEELLDSPDVPPDLLVQNLKELDFLNRFTGGHAISLEGVKRLLNDTTRPYHVVDLGCGSGDWLRYLAERAKPAGFRFKLTGVDKNPHAIEYLRNKSGKFPEIKGYAGEYNEFLNESLVDVFHCSLFCHHLPDDELIELLRQMNAKARIGFVINDLQRSPMAYYGAKITTSVLRGSVLSKHDGPISVLRGFRKEELEKLLQKAGVNDYSIYRRRFFRFLVIGRPSVDVK